MSNYTALVLEDSPTQAVIISRMIEVLGWKVVRCHRLEEALEVAASIRFQALFLDIFVHEHNSLEHISRFRELAPGATIVTMTAGSGKESLEYTLSEARKSQATFVLTKPFSSAILKNILSNAVEDAEAGQKRTHILVVDDSATLRKLICSTYAKADYRVSAVESMEDAIYNIDIAHVDLVLTDIFMAGMGGLEGIKTIKKTWPMVRIIAMSAGLDQVVSTKDVLAIAQGNGADASINKPFTPDALLEVTEATLSIGTELILSA